MCLRGTVNNKSQSSSEIYTNARYSGRDGYSEHLTETKINTVQLYLIKIIKVLYLCRYYSFLSLDV
jgi:hypothetical protein